MPTRRNNCKRRSSDRRDTASGAPINNGSVLIRAGKIVAVGANVAAPAGVRIVDTTGKVVVPGMIDNHSHIAARPTDLNDTPMLIGPQHRFIDALDSFDDVHLGVLRPLRFRQESGLESIPVTELLTEVFPHGTDDDFKFSVFMPAMNRLAAEYGFVRRRAEKTGGRIMLGINPDGLSFHALCVLSPLGIRFVQFLDGEARERE